MSLRRDECPRCFEEILVGIEPRPDGVAVRLALQLEEAEVFSEKFGYVRGHERHWKYCTSRPASGSASAEPPNEPPDEPDKVLDE